MTHKVHPKVYRLRDLTDWESRWLNKKRLPEYLEEDFRIREFLTKKLKDCGIQRIEIERFPGKINIIISSSRPGLIIGRAGKGSEELKRDLEGKILKGKEKEELRIEIKEIRNPWAQAALVSQWVAQQIEKRMPYHRILKQTLEKIMSQKEVKGARVEVAGRLNGAEIARKGKLTKGCLPLQTIRADIDYAQARAYCTYGVIGVKVWIYKGEARYKDEKF